tara:strand:- start:214 stop:543 length:330 start_codon:yes stop_codon:yes gene_type:complete
MPAADNYGDSNIDNHDADNYGDSDNNSDMKLLSNIITIITILVVLVCICCVQPWISMHIAKRAFKASNTCAPPEMNKTGAWRESTLLWHLCCPCMACIDWNLDFPKCSA